MDRSQRARAQSNFINHPTMLCYAQTCHLPAPFFAPSFDDVFDDVFDDMLSTPSCSMEAQVKARRAEAARLQRAAEAARRAEKQRQRALRAEAARRAEHRKRQMKMLNDRNLRAKVMQDTGDAVTFALHIVKGVPNNCRIRIVPASDSALRVSMVQERPDYQPVYDFFGHRRLVQVGVQTRTIWSEEISIRADVPLSLDVLQARAVGPNVVAVTVPYVQQQARAEEGDEEDVAVDGVDDADNDVADDVADDEFEIQIEVNDVETDQCKETSVTESEHVDVTLAPEPLMEEEVDGSVEDCPLDEPLMEEEIDGSVEDCPVDDE